MCKLSIRYYIGLLTFLIGVSSVSIWFLYQNSQEAPLSVFPSQTVAEKQVKTESLIDDKRDNLEETQSWTITNNDRRTRSAEVVAWGQAPGGRIRATLKIQCSGEDHNDFYYYPRLISLSVDDSGHIDFDTDYFEGPGTPASKKNLAEIRAVSPRENLTIKTSVAGWANQGFEFGFNSDKTDKLARLTAECSTEVTVVIHDYRDFQKTIQTTFPAIDPTGKVAKTLKGCRK